jgi:formylglycine-generating enzyme required for sulfatase activity
MVKPDNSNEARALADRLLDRLREGGEVRPANSLGMKMVWIPAGSFKMGSPASEAGRNSNENQVDVTLTQGFWMGQTELTQGQWTGLMKSEPWKGEDFVKVGTNYAASYVSAKDADEQLAGELPVCEPR